jgi:hypothetical protein
MRSQLVRGNDRQEICLKFVDGKQQGFIDKLLKIKPFFGYLCVIYMNMMMFSVFSFGMDWRGVILT